MVCAISTPTKRALILNGSDDWNGFFVTSRERTSNIEQVKSTYLTQERTLSTKKQAMQVLNAIQGKVEMVWIRAHGDKSRVLFSDSLVLSKKIMRKIGRLVKSNGVVILESCETGQGSGSIASIFSRRCPHLSIYAPNTKLMPESLQFRLGEPTFYAGMEDETIIYRAGQLIPRERVKKAGVQVKEVMNLIFTLMILYRVFRTACAIYHIEHKFFSII